MQAIHTLSRLSAITLVLGAIASPAQAEVYKWVDEQGRTHYGNKVDATQEKSTTVKIAPQPTSTEAPKSYWKYLSDTGKPAAKPEPTPSRSETPSRPPMLSNNGHDDGTDLAKCNIAQDVLSGALKLKNGEPFGDYERKTALDDIKRHCR